MVSIRRQRLIKQYGRSPSLEDISSSENNGQSPGSWWQNTRSVGMQHLSSVNQDNEEITKSEEGDSSMVTESNTSNQQPVPLPEFKRRKRHRRKNIDNQEQVIMRGVYYKNMKWQAAIKVDKKQIHLGTVGSQEEAARLYDRAAYLCGREPNFDLTTEEKEELSKLSWDDFLIMTRNAINSKKSQRRVSSRMMFENLYPSNSGSEVEAVAVAEVQAEADQGRNGFSGFNGADISAVAIAEVQAGADQMRNGFSGFVGADISAVAVADHGRNGFSGFVGADISAVADQGRNGFSGFVSADISAVADQGRNGFSGFVGADIAAVAVAEVQAEAEADQGRNGFSGPDGADVSAA